MAAIRASIEISRHPEDVFSYATDPSNLPAWQDSLASVRRLDAGPLDVGSRVVVTRQIGPSRLPLAMVMTTTMSELVPSSSWGISGVDGPVRAKVRGTIEPIGDGESSRVTLALDFETHGIGKLLAPLIAIPMARTEVSKNLRTLKSILETGR